LVLLFAYLAILAFYSWGWFVSGKKVNVVKLGDVVTITVVVPARNEEANIAACLESLLAQDYDASHFEVMVVDDASEDGTAEILRNYAAKDSRIKWVQLQAKAGEQAFKKRAVEAGIAAATGTLIVCTDADCTHHTGWLSALSEAYAGGKKKFMAAPVVYHTQPTFLSVFQTLDFMTLQGITAASVATGFHTMCNGANIAYERDMFYAVSGFSGIDDLPTGDDMLLMHKIYRKNPNGIIYVRSNKAMVTTHAAASWKAFFQQRIRWASKAAYYDDRRIFRVLLLVYFFNVWCLLLGIGAIFSHQSLSILGFVIGLKTVSEMLFLIPVASFFGKLKWMVFFPFFQPVHILYTLVAGWLGRFGRYEWKGRVIEAPDQLKANGVSP
jgi:cellulose synthase/poly-beta-1,6-N-acetylglucosamine synthase-like glycosyltransferase